jgi:hypothetical protein
VHPSLKKCIRPSKSASAPQKVHPSLKKCIRTWNTFLKIIIINNNNNITSVRWHRVTVRRRRRFREGKRTGENGLREEKSHGRGEGEERGPGDGRRKI